MPSIKILNSSFLEQLELELAPGIKAGFPSPAGDYLQGSLGFNRGFIRHPNATFYDRVSGDSMIDTGISDGDITIIDRSMEAGHNDVIVAYFNGKFTTKYLDMTHMHEDYIGLRPAGKAFRPIRISELDEFEMWGVVVWTIKNWKK